MRFEARRVSFSARGGHKLLDDVSLRIAPGQVHALLGPNGAGKSTLLNILAGDLQPQLGDVTLNQRPLLSWTPRERARQRAVLPQRDSLRFGFTVLEVATLGRLPCLSHSPERESEIIRDALAAVNASHLTERIYTTLSGGERARVQLARLMTQLWEPVEYGPRYLLLDEPTASLDLAHQHACLKMTRAFAAGGVGVLAILHDPNLAMSYADEVTLLRDGRMLAGGTPPDTLTAENLESLYGIAVTLHRPAGSDRPIVWATLNGRRT